MTDEEYRDALLSCDLYKQACSRGVRENTDIGGRLWLAGTGPATAPVMVVTAVVTPDEAAASVKGGWDRDNDCWRMLPRTPRSFSSPQHNAFKDLALQAGLDMEKCYCTSLVKFLPEEPKNRNKPPKWLVDLCLPVLEADIARVKPCIIVCADKVVHDALVKVKGMKFTEADLYGAWLYSKNYNARIYLTKKPSYVEKLDFRERFLFDFGNVARELKAMDGKGAEKLPVNCRVVRHSIELVNLVGMLERENRTVLSVDCEWSGEHHVDGKLRSLQIAWSDTDAAYIRFMDDQMNYAFDVPYKEAGRILGRWCDRPEVKYIGHQLSADLSWMHHVLGLEYYGKGMFDSEFALQACDESSELGLDVLALRYTDLGKYDLDLIVWKKNHGDLVKKYGYGMIPDDIMIPYGVRDVLVVYRAWPRIWEWMGKQGLQKYWNDILGPMVTDVFTYLTLTGIPIDRAKMDEARVLYNWARDEFGKELAKAICDEADTLLVTALENAGAGDLMDGIRELVQEGNAAGARERLRGKGLFDADPCMETIFDHYVHAPAFNVQSPVDMRRWLFDVKGYTPLKTTSLKDQGMPAMDWAKIAIKPPAEQAKYTPATDQATLETLASRNRDGVLDKLLQYKKICNICKSFLKEADTDKDGEVVKENGLHYWLASDDCIHTLSATTETGRPRSY